ncbi:transport system permease protein [Methanocorpusculum labreanum Z]|uniref:Cobalamin import system permease protein BtuC n=1 Tax=Methanocorpusculum labreanum (strain ATCC 43576 / DSM 4855 / Z) TaxID=410358 RepID=A2ST87_METLZ|nr:iron chelate uptake ABC transporter family permease subunit [Methanocorpusculum labreanum]ABN07543.1 transport system permease protein [Methanocorpusculum labreanum Z]
MLRHPVLLLPVLLIVLLISIVLTTCIGVSGFSLLTFDSEMIRKLIFEVRLPRVIGALLVGGGLAAAGCVMQGLFRNPMADPYIIGTSTGGALGAACAIVFLGGLLMPLFAFIGAAASTITVYLISQRNGRMAVETLLLSGIAVSLFLSAMLSFIMYLSGNSLHQIMFWMMGGFWNMYWDDVGLALLIPAAAVILYLFSRDLNVMALGEEEAIHLGVNTERTKKILLMVATFITAIAVSISGCIGFIGLIIPHIMRIFTGPDHRILLPASVLAGAILLMWADTFARTLPVEIPVGIVTAFLGAPFFIYLLRRRTRV